MDNVIEKRKSFIINFIYVSIFIGLYYFVIKYAFGYVFPFIVTFQSFFSWSASSVVLTKFVR